MQSDGCHGGGHLEAFEMMKTQGVSDETCSIYRARGHDNGIECSQMVKCQNCLPEEGCFETPVYNQYEVDEFGPVAWERDIMQEVFQRGPIPCYIRANQELDDYTGGIFIDKTGLTETNHVVSIVGWGVESGLKFWRVRNSWGSSWGEEGFFRIVRGVNNLGLEEECAWATPTEDLFKVINITNSTNTTTSE